MQKVEEHSIYRISSETFNRINDVMRTTIRR